MGNMEQAHADLSMAIAHLVETQRAIEAAGKELGVHYPYTYTCRQFQDDIASLLNAIRTFQQGI